MGLLVSLIQNPNNRGRDCLVASNYELEFLSNKKIIASMNKVEDRYVLMDSGNGRKLERFGSFVFSRPSASAVWRPCLDHSFWSKADAVFDRDGGNSWSFARPLPERWNIQIDGISFILSATDFGHLGVFPEHRAVWNMLRETIKEQAGRRAVKVLNLFAYTGGLTLAAAECGAHVCHVDASKGMVSRARENAQVNDLSNAPIRWIVDDVGKFLKREIRRGSKYDMIVLDPPSFGRGKAGEVYKIERDLVETLDQCAALLSDDSFFVALTCHTPAFTPAVLSNLLSQTLSQKKGKINADELLIDCERPAHSIPSGSYAIWTVADSFGGNEK